MSVILGKDIKIYQGDTGTTPIIAAAKSCTVSMKSDVIERSSAVSATAKEFVAGRTEWEVSIGHLLVSDAPYDGLLKTGQTFTLSIVIGDVRKVGKAICMAADINASVGSLGTGSAKFKGSGELASATS